MIYILRGESRGTKQLREVKKVFHGCHIQLNKAGVKNENGFV